MRIRTVAIWLGHFAILAISTAALGQPIAPSQTSASCSSDTATVHWQDNSNNETKFEVRRRHPGGPWAQVAEVPADTESWSEPPHSLTIGQIYCYSVIAHNALGPSGASPEVCVYSLAEPGMISPTPGQNLPPNTPVTFSWSPVTNANRYSVRLRSGTNCGGPEIAQTGATQHITNLADGTYTWSVVALNISGTTSFSSSDLNSCWTFYVNQAAQDTQSPSITITHPTSDDAHTTPNSEIELDGTASDNVGITQITWNNSTSGGSGTCFGTSNWGSFPIPLLVGDNFITVTARDAANNQATDDITVTYAPPPGLPTVTLAPITEVSTSSATSGGIVTDQGSSGILQKGVCWNTTGYPNNFSTKTTEGPGGGIFNSFMTGLTPGTTYYVRAYAINTAGVAFSSQSTFSTMPSSSVLPTVAIANVNNITQTSASCDVSVSAQGGSNVIARGVCWNTTGAPTVESSFTFHGTGLGNFSSTLTGLLANTTYYVRGYATNAAGSAYSNQLQFTTTPTPRCLLSLVSNPPAGGSITASPPQPAGGYLFGTVVTVTANPFAGYQFALWNGAVTGSNITTTVVMYEDRSITANFVAPSLPNKAWFGGRVSDAATGLGIPQAYVQWGDADGLTDGGGQYMLSSVPCATDTLQVTKSGYQSWSESYTPTCNLNSARNIVLTRNKVNLTVLADKAEAGGVKVNGTLQTLPWSGTLDHGAAVSLEAAPASGWAFDYWARDGASLGSDAPYTFAITGDTSVTAFFKQAPVADPPMAQAPPCGAMGNCGATGVASLAFSIVGLGLQRKKRTR